MSQFLKTAATTGLAFGLAMGIAFTISFRSPWAILAGLPSGLMFGLLLAAFMQWQRTRFTQENPCVDGERLLRQGPANHFRGWESVGGWLYLTDKRLLFKSHKFNVQNHELSLPLAEIVSAQPAMTAWIVPNGLKVDTGCGFERFVVSSRGDWADDIMHAKQ